MGRRLSSIWVGHAHEILPGELLQLETSVVNLTSFSRDAHEILPGELLQLETSVVNLHPRRLLATPCMQNASSNASMQETVIVTRILMRTRLAFSTFMNVLAQEEIQQTVTTTNNRTLVPCARPAIISSGIGYIAGPSPPPELPSYLPPAAPSLLPPRVAPRITRARLLASQRVALIFFSTAVVSAREGAAAQLDGDHFRIWLSPGPISLTGWNLTQWPEEFNTTALNASARPATARRLTEQLGVSQAAFTLHLERVRGTAADQPQQLYVSAAEGSVKDLVGTLMGTEAVAAGPLLQSMVASFVAGTPSVGSGTGTIATLVASASAILAAFVFGAWILYRRRRNARLVAQKAAHPTLERVAVVVRTDAEPAKEALRQDRQLSGRARTTNIAALKRALPPSLNRPFVLGSLLEPPAAPTPDPEDVPAELSMLEPEPKPPLSEYQAPPCPLQPEHEPVTPPWWPDAEDVPAVLPVVGPEPKPPPSEQAPPHHLQPPPEPESPLPVPPTPPPQPDPKDVRHWLPVLEPEPKPPPSEGIPVPATAALQDAQLRLLPTLRLGRGMLLQQAPAPAPAPALQKKAAPVRPPPSKEALERFGAQAERKVARQCLLVKLRVAKRRIELLQPVQFHGSKHEGGVDVYIEPLLAEAICKEVAAALQILNELLVGNGFAPLGLCVEGHTSASIHGHEESLMISSTRAERCETSIKEHTLARTSARLDDEEHAMIAKIAQGRWLTIDDRTQFPKGRGRERSVAQAAGDTGVVMACNAEFWADLGVIGNAKPGKRLTSLVQMAKGATFPNESFPNNTGRTGQLTWHVVPSMDALQTAAKDMSVKARAEADQVWGLPIDQLIVHRGYGSTKPLPGYDSDGNFEQNRRVEMRLLEPGEDGYCGSFAEAQVAARTPARQTVDTAAPPSTATDETNPKLAASAWVRSQAPVENKHHAWVTQPTVTWSMAIQRDVRSRLFQTHPQIQPNQLSSVCSSADNTTSSGSSGGSRRSRVAAPTLESSAEREPLALPLLLAQVLQLTTTALPIAAAPVNYPTPSSGTDSASSSSRSLDPSFQRPDHTSREVWM